MCCPVALVIGFKGVLDGQRRGGGPLEALEAGWGGRVLPLQPFYFSPVLLLQQFRARGRGWGRGNFSGNNNSNSGGNNDFQKRSREEEWDPEYTPKSKKYYLVRTWVLRHPRAPDVSGLRCFGGESTSCH